MCFRSFFFQCVETSRCWRTTVSLTPFKSRRVSVTHFSSGQPACFFLQCARSLTSLNPRLRSFLLALIRADKWLVSVVSTSCLRLVAFFFLQNKEQWGFFFFWEEMFGALLPFRPWKIFSDRTNGTARGPIQAQKLYVWSYGKHCGCYRIAQKNKAFVLLKISRYPKTVQTLSLMRYVIRIWTTGWLALRRDGLVSVSVSAQAPTSAWLHECLEMCWRGSGAGRWRIIGQSGCLAGIQRERRTSGNSFSSSSTAPVELGRSSQEECGVRGKTPCCHNPRSPSQELTAI